ncbi:specifically androgen-regulated gene protein isoform X2 [Leuresthes tenuis]
MSKSGTWPGAVAMEPSSNMDSAESCDSVISMNSGYSDDSMEHLSAEERACLVYLEETIEALEVQEDSGLSNDEPDAWSKAEKEMDQMRINDISSLTSESGTHVLSTPLAPTAADSAPQTFEIKTEHRAVNQRTEPQSTPGSAAHSEAAERVDLVAPPNPPVTESATGGITHPSVNPTEALSLTLDGACHPKSVTSTGAHPGLSTEVDLGIIPPPSDFMDEPDTPSLPEKVNVPPPAGISTMVGAKVDLEPLHPGVPAEKPSASPSVNEESPAKPPPVGTSSFQLSSPPEVPEPKSPPVVAPKPKKLPANIILKSHKTAASFDGNSGHSVPTSSDRVLLDPQRVRMEALRKLGLLKSNEEDASPCLSPRIPTKTKLSWASSSAPASPAAPQTPPTTPSSTHVNSPPSAFQPVLPAAVLPSATSTAPPIQGPDCLLAPAAFRDPIGPLSSNNDLPAVKGVTKVTASSPPLTPPALVKQLTPPKVIGKSATLERSGLGLSKYITHQNSAEAGQDLSSEQSPRQLRSSRPRPASLGSGKDFSQAKGEDLKASHATSEQPHSQMFTLAQTGLQHSKESAKLPRTQGISVLICPRAENEEDRREALRKLGLIRD